MLEDFSSLNCRKLHNRILKFQDKLDFAEKSDPLKSCIQIDCDLLYEYGIRTPNSYIRDLFDIHSNIQDNHSRIKYFIKTAI